MTQIIYTTEKRTPKESKAENNKIATIAAWFLLSLLESASFVPCL